ncbi:MAG: TolC family protein [Acidobacteria bacterium]|nr:TolC family protein [Acidobacteriota bacterium]
MRATRVPLLAALLACVLRGAGPLTLQQALSFAEQNHPLFRIATARIEGAEAGIVTARAYPNPEAGVLAGHQRARLLGTTPGPAQVFSFSQPMETPGVRSTRIQSAELGRESHRYGLEEARIAVRAAVRQAFYHTLRRKAELRLAEENQKLIEDLRRRVQIQVETGEAPRLELTRADAEVAIARTSAKAAELRVLTALAALRAAANIPSETPIDAQGTLDPPVELPALDAMRGVVLERYPALQRARTEVRRAEMRLKNENAQRRPQPTLRSEYEHQPEVATYRVGVSLPVPLWNKREGPIGEAAAALRQSNSTLDLQQLEISAALESAYGRYQLASQQLSFYQEGVLKQAEAALQAAESAYKFGERGIIEVLDAQRVLRGARSDFLSAQFDRQSALIELDQLRALDLMGEKQ